MRSALALAALLALGACDAAPAPRSKPDQGSALLRVVYRDADADMVLMVPEKGSRKAVPKAVERDCAAPLLIDGRTKAVRVLDEAEVQARLKTMQLAGATRGACP
ncbi:hypothetical protein [Novosphingobium sp. PASSN1]|uniref:hypothetical protein n=1 Tax=Novosphingobium sp. PASSN1 TaxID=2015561 RepID=UPI000BDD6CFB|nr:hypothetical protein [Novosphingobium sp. PASSN1]OYU33486.1 MAG: hypothetical protein CFE35_20130 [Novosphingobium sp. PASSN1]